MKPRYDTSPWTEEVNDAAKHDRRPTITEPIESRNMTLLELGPHDCRYPTSPDDTTSHLFCGAEQVDGSSYCAHHDAVCCRPVRTWNPNPRGVTSQRSIGVGAGKDPSAVDDLPHGKTRAEHTGSSS